MMNAVRRVCVGLGFAGLCLLLTGCVEEAPDAFQFPSQEVLEFPLGEVALDARGFQAPLISDEGVVWLPARVEGGSWTVVRRSPEGVWDRLPETGAETAAFALRSDGGVLAWAISPEGDLSELRLEEGDRWEASSLGRFSPYAERGGRGERSFSLEIKAAAEGVVHGLIKAAYESPEDLVNDATFLYLRSDAPDDRHTFQAEPGGTPVVPSIGLDSTQRARFFSSFSGRLVMESVEGDLLDEIATASTSRPLLAISGEQMVYLDDGTLKRAFTGGGVFTEPQVLVSGIETYRGHWMNITRSGEMRVVFMQHQSGAQPTTELLDVGSMVSFELPPSQVESQMGFELTLDAAGYPHMAFAEKETHRLVYRHLSPAP